MPSIWLRGGHSTPDNVGISCSLQGQQDTQGAKRPFFDACVTQILLLRADGNMQPAIHFFSDERLRSSKENAFRREGVQRMARTSVTMPLMLSVSEEDYRWHTRISRRPDKLERYGTLSLFNAWRGTSVGYSSSDHSNRINDRCAYGLDMQVLVFPVV